MFDYMGAFLFRSGFAQMDNVITKRGSKTSTWLLLSRLQGNKPHRNSPEPSETLELSGTLRKPPEPSGSSLRNLNQHTTTPAHTGTIRNHFGTCLQNLHQHTPELSGTCLRNLHQHTRELSGICFRNLHQHTPELSGTFWNLPPEPPPAHTGTLRNSPEPASRTYTGTLRNLLEPSSGTCSSDLHRHTPELIWAEDPISLRCWGKNSRVDAKRPVKKWLETVQVTQVDSRFIQRPWKGFQPSILIHFGPTLEPYFFWHLANL